MPRLATYPNLARGGRHWPPCCLSSPTCFLKVNYRTHSGILDVASSVVDVLKRFFPQHIDPLKRERAFLPVR